MGARLTSFSSNDGLERWILGCGVGLDVASSEIFEDDRLCLGDVGGVNSDILGCRCSAFNSLPGSLVGGEGGVLMVRGRIEGLRAGAMSCYCYWKSRMKE